MKIDAYTRFLLTVIALCLVYLCVRDIRRVPKVQAVSPVRVVLVDNDNFSILSGGGIKPLRVDVVK